MRRFWVEERRMGERERADDEMVGGMGEERVRDELRNVMCGVTGKRQGKDKT